MLGRKPIMLGSIVVFAAGSAMAGAAKSLGLILSGRLIQGIGGGAIPLMAELIISDQLPLQQRPQILGMVMATSCLGLVFRPIIGGAIVDHSTWRWIFYFNVPLAGASLVCLFPVLGRRTAEQRGAAQSPQATAKRFDWAGNLLLPASSVAILLSLTMGGSMYAWDSARIFAPLVLGVCGLLAFGVYEHFCPCPLLPINPTAIAGKRFRRVAANPELHPKYAYHVGELLPDDIFPSSVGSLSTRSRIRPHPDNRRYGCDLYRRWGSYVEDSSLMGHFDQLDGLCDDVDWPGVLHYSHSLLFNCRARGIADNSSRR